jgi:hypothetical protein
MANRYFLNVGTNFNTTANWSTSSGGAGGASVPGSSDVVILDNNSGNLSLEININVQGISMTAGYASTFTQNAFTINYSSGFWTVAGGTFVGSASAITGSTSSRFIMSGGTFTSTSGTHTVGVAGTAVNSINITGGTFNHNNGKFLVLGLNHTQLNNLSSGYFYDFEINTCITCQMYGQIYVQNTLTVTNCNTTANSIICNLKGDFVQGSLGGFCNLIFEGTGTQNLTCPNTTNIIASVTINKPSGTLNIINDFAWYGNWNHIAGTINWNNKKAIARFANNGFTITNGQFYTLEQNSTSGVTISSAGTPIQCDADFILNGQTGVNSFPAVKFKGNLSILTSNGTCSGITFNGTGSQSFTSSVSSYNLGSIDINKSAGTVTLNQNFTMLGSTNDINLVAGTFNQNGFTFLIPDALNETGGTFTQGAGALTVGRFLLVAGIYNEGAGGIILTGTDFIISVGGIFNRHANGGLYANGATATALNLGLNGYTLTKFLFARLTSSLTLLSSIRIAGNFEKTSTATTSNIIGAYMFYTYSSRALSTSPTFIFNGAVNQTVTTSDGKLDSGNYQVDKPSGKVTQLSAVTIDNGQAGDNGLNVLFILKGVWCTNEFNLTVDGSAIISSQGELRKTPASTITATIVGSVTNVNSCDEKKTLFFLVV